MSSPPSLATEALPSLVLPAPRRWPRAAVRGLAGLLVAAWSIALLGWLTLHWGILPRLDDWRPQIEARVGAALGAPLSIGAIRVSSGGWVPAFELDDVRVLDRQGRTALSLGRVSAAISPSSLWALEPRFAQLHVQGVQLDVRRSADGRIRIAGLEMDERAEPADPALLDWFLEQHEFVIRGGTLRWTDELRGAESLTLTDVDLVLRNGARRHELRLDATPPAEWGQRLAVRGSFTQPITARASELRRWAGALYVELPEADVSQLRRHVQLPFLLEQGRGALRGWFELGDGLVQSGTADLALSAVSLRLGKDLPSLELRALRGRLRAAQKADGVELAIEQLGFVTEDGVPWAPNTLRLTLRRDPARAAEAPWTGGELRIDHLALAPLARLAARLPLPSGVHRAIASLDPQGELQQLALDWSGPPTAPSRYRASGRATGLALAAGPPGPPAHGLPQTAGRPGLRGATLSLEATERGGQARLAIAQGMVELPGVLEEPEIPIEQLATDLAWTITPGRDGQPPAVQLEARGLKVVNADAELHLDGRWNTGPGVGFGAGKRLPGVLALEGKLLRGVPARVARYLPLGVPAHAREYVARALADGRVTGGEIAINGDLWRVPFVDGGPGTFRIQAQVQGLRYAFLPSTGDWTSPWPAMTGVAGTLVFDRAAMRIRDARAQIGGVALQSVKGGVEDLVNERVLKLDGQARGALTDMIRFVNDTPVGNWIGGALRQTTGAGGADLSLALSIPLAEPANSTVRGVLQLAGNELRLLPGTPQLAQLRGRVDFSERGLNVSGGRARALGGELSFDGGTQPDGHLRFQGQGVASAEGLLRPGELPVLSPLAAVVGQGAGARLRGQSPYRLQLDLRQGRPELLVTSSLAGMALDLPPPLTKPASATWPLRLQTNALPPAAGRGPAQRLRLDVEGVLQAQVDLGVDGDPGQVLRAAYAVGRGTELPANPAPGGAAVLKLAQLDLDAWRRFGAGTGAGDAADADPTASPWWPAQVALQVESLRLGGRRIEAAELAVARRASVADTGWRVEGRAAQGEGWLEWRQPRDAAQPGRLSGHLVRLDMPEGAAAEVESWATQAPAGVPGLALVVDDFRWRGKALGRLEIEAENRRGAAGRRDRPLEWQLDRLRLSTPEATLLARGLWSPGQRSSMAFDLTLGNGGAFFERLGAGKGMQGAPGRLEGELSWPGSPLAMSVPQLRGKLRVALGEGRFLNAEPGVARLFGVLSLQALPRRLLLDFRDVFQQGLAFDRIEGEISLADGVARTGDLRVLGVQAAVLIEGSADLQHETQDLRIVAVPEFNTAGASLAWAALNPAIGLGAFVAQMLLNKPMTAAATREFHVTGPWGEPKVERIERAAATAASAASAASGSTP